MFNTADLADQAVALVDFAWADIKARRFATLSQNNPIGQDRAEVTEKRVKELGGKFVEKMLYTVGAKDFRTELMRLMAALSGANLVHDTGLMDQATVTCPEILLLADEIQDMIKHIMKGIEVNEESLALDVVHKVGPGGNYLAEDHTFKDFRSFWNPRLFSRRVATE